MFTGLITELGTLLDISSGDSNYSLMIEADKILDGIQLGDSIATNGVCLTVTSFDKNKFTVDIMPKTLELSSLSELNIGSKLNLENALTLSTKLGGHIVSGHIDTIGVVKTIEKKSNAILITIEPKNHDNTLVIPQGSITIDGISLTIATLDDSTITVSIIPHTLSETNLQYKNIGDVVNIEYDIIGKYLKRYVNYSTKSDNSSNIDMNFLSQNNFL